MKGNGPLSPSILIWAPALASRSHVKTRLSKLLLRGFIFDHTYDSPETPTPRHQEHKELFALVDGCQASPRCFFRSALHFGAQKSATDGQRTMSWRFRLQQVSGTCKASTQASVPHQAITGSPYIPPRKCFHKYSVGQLQKVSTDLKTGVGCLPEHPPASSVQARDPASKDPRSPKKRWPPSELLSIP